jgi:hypothetical protein
LAQTPNSSLQGTLRIKPRKAGYLERYASLDLFMKPRVTVIRICVDDMEKLLWVYEEGLGLKTDGIIGKEFEYGAVAFFELFEGCHSRRFLPMQAVAECKRV